MIGQFVAAVFMIAGTVSLAAVPFNLGDSQIAAFLQVYVALLVFALGGRELLLHSINPAGLRDLIARTSHFYSASWSLLAYLVIGSLICASYGFFSSVIPPSKLGPAIVVALGGGIVATLFSVLYFQHHLQPAQVRRALVRDARRDDWTNRRVSSIGPSRAVDYLATLGTMAGSLGERHAVLDDLAHLIHERARDPRYRGDSLELLLRAVEQVATTEVLQVDGSLVTRGATILKSVRAEIRKREETARTAAYTWEVVDATRAAEAAARIARVAVTRAFHGPANDRDGAVDAALEALDGGPALLSIGLEVAAEAAPGRHPLAIQVGIRVLVEHRRTRTPVSEAYLLGFAAILRAAGPALLGWADQTLVQPLDLDLAKALDVAKAVLLEHARFAAADAIHRWREELAPQAPRSSPRGASSSLVSVHLSPIQVVVPSG